MHKRNKSTICALPPFLRVPARVRGSGRKRGRIGEGWVSRVVAEPKQRLADQTAFGFVGEGERKVPVGMTFVVEIVVPHVYIDHAIALIGPDDGIVSIVPDLVWLGAGAEREAGWIDGEQNVDIGVGPQVLAPPVPFVRRGAESGR